MSQITKENLLELQAKGYQAALTADEYQERFPWLPIDKAYLSPNMTISMLYYDPEQYTCCELNIYGDQYLRTLKEDDGGALPFKRINLCKESFASGDYRVMLRMCPVDAYTIELLGHMIQEHPEMNFLDIFREYYNQSDYGFENIPNDTIVALYDKAPASHKKRIRKQFKDKETVTIYRGEGEKSQPTETALSWTTNPSVAYFFATRFAKEEATIYKADVDVSDILDYFDERDEDEVLIRPKSARIYEAKYLPGMDAIRCLSVKKDYFDEAKRLYRNAAKGHDYKHICRMLVLLKVITPVLDLTAEEVKILHTAILYHDLGRVSEYEDDGHGVLSAKLFKEHNKGVRNADIISSIIAYHCVDDRKAIQVLEQMPKPEMRIKLFKILKDIDALDRVRFGLKELDVKYIRNKELTDYILVANLLLQFDY